MEHRLGLAQRRQRASLEQESSEPQSLAVAGQEDHALAPLTPSRQVRPAQLAFTSHLYRLRVGQLLGRGASVPRNRLCGANWPGGEWPTIPQILPKLPPNLQQPLHQDMVTSHAAIQEALVTSQ